MTPKRRILPVFVPHLGCPHTCVFCDQRRITGAGTPVTPEDVTARLAALPAGEPVELAFYGGSFTAIPAQEQEALLGAAQPFLRQGRLTGLRISTRPDCVDDAVLARLLRLGVTTVELGVQSMCPEVLAASRRGHTPQDARRAAGLVKGAGLSLILQMMTGLPEDTPERSEETARALAALEPDGVRIYPTVVLRGTALWRLWQTGAYRPQTVEEAVELCARLWQYFDEAGIPVIRCGLNPSDALSGGEAAAGAYHPAFGELVMSRRYLHLAQALLRDAGCAEAVLGVAPGQISAATGQHRENIRRLTEEFGLKHLEIRQTDVEKGQLRLLSVAK